MTFSRVGLVGLLTVLGGCMTVQKVQPANYIPLQHPTVVWVTTNDNAFTPVSQPQIVGDTLKGTWVGLQEPVAISLAEIKSVQAKMPSPKRTAILATVLAVTVGGAVYSIATAGNSGTLTNCGATKGTMNNYCCTVDPGDKNIVGSC